MKNLVEQLDNILATWDGTNFITESDQNDVRRDLDKLRAALSATPAPASDEVLAELEELLAEATKGPWRIVEFKEPAGNYEGAPSLGTDYLIVMDEEGEMWDVEPTEANQKLKVALRNAAPALLARVRQAEAPLAAIKEHLKALENAEVEPREHRTAEGEHAALLWVVSLFEKGAQ